MGESKGIKSTEEQTSGIIIAQEVAEQEVESWFEFKKIRPDLRNKPNQISGIDSQREAIVSSVMYGIVTFNPETGELTQVLQFPLTKEDGTVFLSKLTFKPRLTRLEVMNCSKGLKPMDIEGKQAAYLSAVVGKPTSVLNQMDEMDRGLSDVIAGYFWLNRGWKGSH